MKLSQAIYRLSKLSRLFDIDGSENDVAALNMAVEIMSAQLKDAQSSLSVKHVSRPADQLHRIDPPGLFSKLGAKIKS